MTLDGTVTLQFTLHPSSVTGTITVTGEAPVIDQTSTTTGASFSEQLFKTLPVTPLGIGAGALAADKAPAIGGYCPGAYAKMGKAVKGDARWSSEHEGQTFLFFAPQAKELFDEDPAGTAAKADKAWPSLL